MASGISSIGPLTLDELIEPTTIDISGPPNVRGGVPAKITTGLVSRILVEQLESLVHNPRRRQQIAGADGVLEWVETTAPLDRWRGWWLFSGMRVDYTKRQFLLGPTASYVPIELSGVYFGQSLVPIVSSTFRAKSNDFGLAGTAITPSCFPFVRLDAYGATEFLRQGNGQSVGLYVASDTRRVARTDSSSLFPTYTDARPHLVDAAGTAWYGPRTQGVVGIETALLQLLLNSDGTWTVNVRKPSAPASWYTVESALGIYEGSSSASLIVGSRVLDDGASLTVQNSFSGHYYTVTVYHGSYGVRVLSSGFARWLDTGAVLGSLSGNVYLETASLPGGGKRFVALVRNAVSTDLTNGKVRIGADQEGFVGWEPPSPSGQDTSANQGQAFLYDRNVLLTVE